MKFLNLAFIAVFMFTMISCGGGAKKTTHIEEAESVEMDDNDDEDDLEEDESDYLQAAMDALNAGDSSKAVEKIIQAAEHIKGYVGEMDDPVNANNAIATLLEIATKIKTGTKMNAAELEEAVLKLDFFSEDDLELDDEEIEDLSPESEE